MYCSRCRTFQVMGIKRRSRATVARQLYDKVSRMLHGATMPCPKNDQCGRRRRLSFENRPQHCLLKCRVTCTRALVQESLAACAGFATDPVFAACAGTPSFARRALPSQAIPAATAACGHSEARLRRHPGRSKRRRGRKPSRPWSVAPRAACRFLLCTSRGAG